MTEQPTKEKFDIKVGQVWQENDPRLTRFVRVLGFEGPYGVVIRRCDEFGRIKEQYRTTIALRRRFNGSRSGYKLASQP